MGICASQSSAQALNGSQPALVSTPHSTHARLSKQVQKGGNTVEGFASRASAELLKSTTTKGLHQGSYFRL